MYQPFQIVWAEVEWKGCSDERPWLLVDVRKTGEVYGAFPIAGDSYPSGGTCIMLHEDHADFPHSGLNKRSYVFYDSTIEIGADEIRKNIGRLTGNLLEKLKQEAGL